MKITDSLSFACFRSRFEVFSGANQEPMMNTRRNRLKACFVGRALTAALISTSLFVSATASSAKENWPQWRGPTATGVAPNANPPTSWSETNNVKWKIKIPGRGNATPIVWGDKVFVQTAVATGKKVEAPSAKPDAAVAKPDSSSTATNASAGDQPPGQGRRRGGFGGPGGPGGGMRSEKPDETYQFVILCLDRQTGKTLWEKVAREEVPHEGHHPDGTFASNSPMTDGKYVFAYFGSRGLYCYDMAGNLKWKKDFGQMKTKMSFGEGSSAALSGNTIVINWDHEDYSFIMALNKETGKQIWRESRDEKTSWATPLIIEHEGKSQVITDASNKIRSYDLASGKLLWECGPLTANVIPSPVAGNGMVYSMSGFRGNSLLAIRLGKTGDLTGTDSIVWSHNKGTPYVPSPLLYGDKLYFFSGNNGMLSCLDAKSGKVLIDMERLEDLKNVYASPVGASDRVYLVGRNGAAMVIKNSDKLEVLSSNRLEEEFDASPAIVGKELFLRGKQYLYCIAEK